MFPFPAIDGVILSLEKEEQVAKTFSIQITLLDNHDDSEAEFFTRWTDWCSDLLKQDHKIEVTFMWVIIATDAVNMVEEKCVRESRSGEKLIHPEYRRLKVPIQLANHKVWKRF